MLYMTGVYSSMLTFDQRMLLMLMNKQVTVGAKERVNYEVTVRIDVAAESGEIEKSYLKIKRYMK